MTVTEVSGLSQFKEIISKDKASIFHFWAPWCTPCRLINPSFERFSNDETYRTVGFYKVDIDDNFEDIGKEVDIRVMPYFIVFKNGVKVDTLAGASHEKLNALVATAAANSK